MSEAAAEASRWIAASPNLTVVLDWHRRLHGCGPGEHCAEYAGIIEEYGAGPSGSAVFWPDD